VLISPTNHVIYNKTLNDITFYIMMDKQQPITEILSVRSASQIQEK